MSTYELMTVDAAIQNLQDIKKKNKKAKIVIGTIDFENDFESRVMTSPDEGCSLVRLSKTIVYNGDNYIPHMQLFTKKQDNIRNIQRIGVLHDIFI